jgi:hypothetical protein
MVLGTGKALDEAAFDVLADAIKFSSIGPSV